MPTKYFHKIFAILIGIGIVWSCTKDDTPTEYTEVTPVTLDLTAVPYHKLSEYHFFKGALQDLTPAYKVIPFEPASPLFTDYASKKRFLWMPPGTQAFYEADNKTIKFPIGTALIKNFYYENIEPEFRKKNIETRIMININRDAQGNDVWIFANYVWNEAQTEAYLDLNGSYLPIIWKKNDGTSQPINYRIPSETECMVCHKKNERPSPIGVKPQNLDFEITYPDGTTQNQLQKWIAEDYLAPNMPQQINHTINWKDPSQPLNLRVRSYLDANCAHCHSDNSHCDYRPIRLGFSESELESNLGVCVPPQDNVDNRLTYIVTKGSIQRSVLYYRINTSQEALRMPIIGRSLIDIEGVKLIQEWIESFGETCN